ncbi:MAG: hypothetical protein Q9169_008019 [Polycauliona sp. 2 TL-2023]
MPAANPWAPTNFPSGFPTRTPKPAAPNDIPILVPAKPTSGDKATITRQDGTREEAIEDTEDHDPRDSTHADPCKAKNPRQEQGWKKRVKGSQTMGHQRRDDPANERTRIDNCEKVESETWRNTDDPFGVDGDVEVWRIESAEKEEKSQSEEGEGNFFERAGFEQGSRFLGNGPSPENDEADDLG